MSHSEAETAFGRWAKQQPRGVLSRAQQATGLAYSTVHAATRKRMSTDVAILLSRFTKGAVKAADIVHRKSALTGGAAA